MTSEDPPFVAGPEERALSPAEADILAASLLGELRTRLGGLQIAHARRVADAVRDAVVTTARTPLPCCTTSSRRAASPVHSCCPRPAMRRSYGWSACSRKSQTRCTRTIWSL